MAPLLMVLLSEESSPSSFSLAIDDASIVHPAYSVTSAGLAATPLTITCSKFNSLTLEALK